jgi:precorrin isomerase
MNFKVPTPRSPNQMIDYLRHGDDIYRKSFSIIRAEANLESLPADLAHVAVRLIHSCGMTDIVQDLQASEDAVTRGRKALIQGAPILCDSLMVAKGITQKTTNHCACGAIIFATNSGANYCACRCTHH